MQQEAIRKWQSDPLYTPHYHETGFLNVTSGKAAQNTKGAVESYFDSLQKNPAFNGLTTRVNNSQDIKIEIDNWVRQSLKRIEALKPKSIMEVGCGDGQILFEIAPTTTRYIATDYSQSGIEKLQEKLATFK